MDPTTFAKSPAAVSLAAIIDELPDDQRKKARSRVTTILGDARSTARALVEVASDRASVEDRRTVRYLLDLVRHDCLAKIEAATLPLKVRTFLANVATSVFRDATKVLKSRTPNARLHRAASVKKDCRPGSHRTALERGLHTIGVRAHVKTEQVPRTRLFRFVVVADQFESMSHAERQQVVWRMAERILPPEELARVSMILTVTMDEISDEPSAKR